MSIFSKILMCTKVEILVPFVGTILISKMAIVFSHIGLPYNERLFYNFPQIIPLLFVLCHNVYV